MSKKTHKAIAAKKPDRIEIRSCLLQWHSETEAVLCSVNMIARKIYKELAVDNDSPLSDFCRESAISDFIESVEESLLALMNVTISPLINPSIVHNPLECLRKAGA